MAEPARRSAGGPAPDDPERKPDPRAGGWADVRYALIASAEACAKSVAGLAAHPASEGALEMARLCLDVFERLGAIAGRCRADEAVMEAERERGFTAGYAAAMAERPRLGVVSGGQAP